MVTKIDIEFTFPVFRYEKRRSKYIQHLYGLQSDYFWCVAKCVSTCLLRCFKTKHKAHPQWITKVICCAQSKLFAALLCAVKIDLAQQNGSRNDKRHTNWPERPQTGSSLWTEALVANFKGTFYRHLKAMRGISNG